MGNISLTASMRSNLQSLHNVARSQSTIQNRLATGLKVSTAIDNPSSFYTARSLNNHARDLSALLDSMSLGVSAIKSASQALEIATSLLVQAKAAANNALESGYNPPVHPPLPPDVPDVPDVPDPPDPPPSANPITANDLKKIINDYGISGSVVTSASELKAALNNAQTGDTIVIFGNVNISEETLTLKNGVKLVGAEHIIRENVLENDFFVRESDKSKISFDFTGTQVSSVGLMVESNTYLSDITINYHTTEKSVANTYAAIQTNRGQNIVLNNLDVNTSASASTPAELRSVYNVSGNITMKGNINVNVDASFGKGLYADYMGTYIQDKNSILNIDIKGQGLEAFRGGKVNLYGVTNVKIDGSGNFMAYGNNTIAGEINVTFVKSDISNIIFHKSNVAFKASANIKIYSIDDVILFIDKTASTDSWEKGTIIRFTSPYTNKTWMANDNNSFSGASIVGLNTGSSLADAPYNWLEVKSHKMSRASFAKTEEPAEEKPSKQEESKNSYNYILEQYENMIKDSSYRGINFLTAQDMTVFFNAEHNSKLDIKGVDATLRGLGISNKPWQSQEDIEKSILELDNAIGQLRIFAEQFGNNFSVISTREDFTNAFVDILTEGADKLTLADMNQESANMLSLQTRQQLAINSLSLASQASRSVLKLF